MLEKESQMTLDIEAWRKVLQLTKILLVIIIETGFHADLTWNLFLSFVVKHVLLLC